MPHVAVIGAGVIGLSTAIHLQEVRPDVQLTLIADKFDTDTTSDGAAGMFRSSLDILPGVPESTVRRWVFNSWKHYERLARSEDSGTAGVYFQKFYHIYDEGKSYRKKPILMRELVYDFRDMTDEEHLMFGGPRKDHGMTYTTFMIECRWYLPWLRKRFVKHGGKVKHGTVKNINELAGQYDVVVNCTGLRACELVKDSLVMPNRGQVFKVKAPWIKNAVYMDDLCWIIPGQEWVVVGGTRQANNPDETIQPQDTEDVWNRARQVVPSLKHAEIIKVWPGLRPSRSPPRIEIENLHTKQGPLKVVHNYGHGGSGVTLSWGSAVDAVKLVQQCLNNGSSKSKL